MGSSESALNLCEQQQPHRVMHHMTRNVPVPCSKLTETLLCQSILLALAPIIRPPFANILCSGANVVARFGKNLP